MDAPSVGCPLQRDPEGWAGLHGPPSVLCAGLTPAPAGVAEACPRAALPVRAVLSEDPGACPFPGPPRGGQCRRTRWARGPAALSPVFPTEEEKGKLVHSVSRPTEKVAVTCLSV